MLFLGLSLLIRKVAIAFKILGANFLVMGYLLFTTYLVYGGLMTQYPHCFKTGSPLMYLVGPLYYYFILALSRPGFKMSGVHLLHLLPFVLHTVELGPFFILSAEEKVEAFYDLRNSELLSYPWGILSFRSHTLLKSGLTLLYMAAGFFLLRKSLTWRFPEKNMVLLWLQLDIVLKALTLGIVFFSYLFLEVFPKQFYRVGDMLFFSDFILCAIFLLLYPEISKETHIADRNTDDSAQQEAVHGDDEALLEDVLDEEEANPKEVANRYTRHFTPEYLNGIEKALAQWVLEEKYLVMDTTLARLANIIQIPYPHLSYYFNYVSKHKYKDWHNQLKIDYACRLMQEGKSKNLTIDAIAMTCGFASKATFYRLFKQRIGQTPSEYLEELSK